MSRGVDVDARGETSVRYDADNDDVVIVHRNAEQQWALSVSADALRDLEKDDTDRLHRLAEGIAIPDAFNGVDWDDIVFEFPKDVQASGFEKSEPELKRVVTSFVADFLPFVGTGKSLYELVAGVDPVTGEEVGRVWAVAGLVVGVFGMKGVVELLEGAFKKLVRVGKRKVVNLKKQKNVVERVSCEVNESIRESRGYKNFQAPYKQETIAHEFELAKDTVFVRVFPEGGLSSGDWLVQYDEIAGLTRAQVKDKLSLPKMPDNIVEVHVPKGTKLRRGVAAPVEAFGGKGGGMQFELLVEEDVKHWFKNIKKLKE